MQGAHGCHAIFHTYPRCIPKGAMLRYPMARITPSANPRAPAQKRLPPLATKRLKHHMNEKYATDPRRIIQACDRMAEVLSAEFSDLSPADGAFVFGQLVHAHHTYFGLAA